MTPNVVDTDPLHPRDAAFPLTERRSHACFSEGAEDVLATARRPKDSGGATSASVVG
jgi:hypothetical protein